MMPPYVIDMRFEPRDGRPFRLWLPLFLLWPLLLVLGVLALVLTILVDVALWALGQRYHAYTPLLIGILGLFAQLSGTSVDIKDSNTNVRLVIN